MKKFIPLLLAVFAVTLASCEKDPDMDKLDNNYLVYTNYDKKADFKTFETYYLPDSILVIGDKENAEYYLATRLNYWEGQYASTGFSNKRLKGIHVLDHYISMDEYEANRDAR